MLTCSGIAMAADPQATADLTDMQPPAVMLEDSVTETAATEEVVIEATDVTEQLLPPYDPANPQKPILEASDVEIEEDAMIPSVPDAGTSAQ